MTEIIRYDKQIFINFRDFEFEPNSSHCFQWVDIKLFRLQKSEAADYAILQDLTCAIEFRDDYVGGGVNPDGDVHGPYMLESVKANSFTPADKSALLDRFQVWLNNCGSPPSDLQDILYDQVVIKIESATSRFILADLDKNAKNDYADIHNGFHEFVLIDRSARYVTLIVATDD